MIIASVKIALVIHVSAQPIVLVPWTVNKVYPLDKCRPIVYNSIIGFFIFGGVAQLVERNTCTVEVAGSIPVASKEKGKYASKSNNDRYG